MNAESREAASFLYRLLERVVGFAIGEDDEHAIGDFRTGMQEIDTLRERWCQRCAAFGRHVRVEGIEIQREGRAIHGEGRKDVARAREGGEPESIAVEVLHQPARFAQCAHQPAGLGVFRQHRARNVEREHQVEPTRFGHDAFLAPAWT